MCVVDWERTSLKPYVDMLDRHAMGLMEEVRKSKIEKIGALGRELLLPCLWELCRHDLVGLERNFGIVRSFAKECIGRCSI